MPTTTHRPIPTTTPVSEYAHAPLLTIPATATLREAARVMHREGVGALVIEGAPDLAGMLSERDIVAAVAAGADPDTELVRSDMTTAVITARPGDPVLDVALTMLDDGIRHLPLVDDVGRRAGMVSLRDVVRPLVLQAMTPPASLRPAEAATP